jgi:nitrate reductase NapD
MNISGIIIQTHPENAVALQARLAALAGVQVHAAKEDGRIVITVEDTPEAAPADMLMQVQTLPGVLSASMIYNYCDE